MRHIESFACKSSPLPEDLEGLEHRAENEETVAMPISPCPC